MTGGNLYFDMSTGDIVGCDEAVTAANIPAQIDGVAVKGISGYAFNHCSNLTSVTLPEGITSIGSFAFCGCSKLTGIVIPDSVTSLGECVFYECTGLTDVTIGKGMTSIAEAMFFFCSGLTTVTIPSNVTAIEKDAFRCSGLTAVTIPDGVTSIGEGAFLLCTSLAEAAIPGSVTTIGDDAFLGCDKLTRVTFEGNAPTVGMDAFPEGVTLYCKEGASGWATPIWNGYQTEVVAVPTYTVTFAANGGTGTMENATGVSGSYTLPASTFTAPEGKQFKGWKVGDAEKAAGDTVTVSADTTVTAVWEDIPAVTYTVTFAANGGTGTMEAVTAGGTYILPATGFAAPEGKRFKCWKVGDVEKAAGTSITVSADITVTAVWEDIPADSAEKSSDGWVAPAIQSTGVNPDASGTAYQSTQPVEIDGMQVVLQAYALKDPKTGYETNYVKIRDIAAALNGTARQFDVVWTDEINLVVVNPYDHPNGQENKTPYSGNQPYTKATAPTKVNGKAVDIAAFQIADSKGGGSTYYKLRDVGQALGFNVGWSAERGIFIQSGTAYTFDN